MPPQVRELDPVFSDCAFNRIGLLDPPSALHAVTMLNPDPPDPPVTPAPPTPQPVVTAAQPGQQVSSDAPKITTSPNSPPPDPPANPPGDPPGNAQSNPPGNSPGNRPGNNNNPAPNPNSPPAPTPRPSRTVTAGSSTFVIDPSGGVVVPSFTHTAGETPQTIANTAFSIGSGGITITAPDGMATTVPIPAAAAGPVPVTIGSSTFFLDPAGTMQPVPKTLHVGDPGVTVTDPAGHVTTMSMAAGGLVLSSSSGESRTIPMPANGNGVPITLGGNTFTMSMDPRGSGGVVVAPGMTVYPNAPASTIYGTVVSLGPNGVVITAPTPTVQTVPIDPSDPSDPTNDAGGNMITLGPNVYSVDPAGEVIIAPGTTLRIGGPAATVSGSTYSLGPSGVVVVDSNGQTSTVGMPTGNGGGAGGTPKTATSIAPLVFEAGSKALLEKNGGVQILIELFIGGLVCLYALL
jgi:hypothetical protein